MIAQEAPLTILIVQAADMTVMIIICVVLLAQLDVILKSVLTTSSLLLLGLMAHR
jgi:hypothetical protein